MSVFLFSFLEVSTSYCDFAKEETNAALGGLMRYPLREGWAAVANYRRQHLRIASAISSYL